MKSIIRLLSFGTIFLALAGCTPFDKIYSHDFSSGYFKLKTPGKIPEKIYLDVADDSLTVYPASGKGKSLAPDISAPRGMNISAINSGSWMYNNTFVKTSADIDLSTAFLKLRPHTDNLKTQLSTNVNGVFYVGFRKDFFRARTHQSQLKKEYSFIRHTGFDFGLLTGIGITPVNPTVTMNRTIQEYDGIVFQKGFAVFGTFENMSIGISVGFDNLLDKNRNIWVYNQKPWIGLVLGIANF